MFYRLINYYIMTVKIKFTGLSAATGPNYSLSSPSGVVTPNNVTKTQLLNGVDIEVSNDAEIIQVTSQGVCTNSVNLDIIGID